MTKTEQNYTPPYFDVIAMFLGHLNPSTGQNSDTTTVGEGSGAYLNIPKSGWGSGVGDRT